MVAILIIFLTLVLWGWVSFLFDEVVKYHHDHHYDDWVLEGRTRGMFWVPKDAKKILTTFPIGVYGWKLTKGRMSWVKTDLRAEHLVNRFLFWGKLWLVYIAFVISATIFFTIAT